MRWPTGRLAPAMVSVLAAGMVMAGSGSAAAQPASLPVPGGVAALARALGLNESTPPSRIMLSAIRVLHERAEGEDAALDARRTAALAYVKQLPVAPPSGTPSGDAVPLPLPAAVWTGLPHLRSDLRTSVLAILIGDRRAALAYYGLCSMNDDTRAYLAAQPWVGALLFDERRAPVLALYGRSIRIRAAQIVPPGPAAVAPIWERLAGAPLTDPEAFLSRLLTKDGGRLALFYDTLVHLDAARLAFVLGDEPAAADRVMALYRAAAVSLAGWNPVARPFSRVPYDAAQLLFTLRLTPEGQLAGPAVSGLWSTAFARQGLPPDPAGEIRHITPGARLDAAGLVALVGVEGVTMRRERTEVWLLAQRVFARASEADWPDILVTVRAYPLFPSLIATLERIGITRPATYAAAIRRAAGAGRGLDRQRRTTSLTLLQGALGLVERARFSRVLDPAQAEVLVGALAALPRSDEGDYLGGVAAWIEEAYLPAVGEAEPSEAARPARPLEDRVLAAMAGATAARRAASGQPSVVDWEGLTFHADAPAAEFARLVAIRRQQAATPLDPALALARTAALVRAAGSAGDVGACARALESAAGALSTPDGTERSAAAVRPASRPLERARAALRALSGPPNPKGLLRIATWIRQASDAYLAEALLSIAYAPHLGNPGTTALLGGDPARRHSFGLEDARAEQAARNPWQLAEEHRGRAEGWYLTGSILNLDVALGRLALRRVASDGMPIPPAFGDAERRALTEAVVFTSPADLTDAARDQIAAALDRGRRRFEALRDPATRADIASAAGLDEWRAEALAWALTFDPPTAADLLSYGDFVRLGSAVPASAPDSPWHPFGTSAWSSEGRLALHYADAAPWTTMSGRGGTRLVPAMMPDLTLALVEALAARRLPATLLRGLLAAATQDLLDQLRTEHDDDWMAMTVQARAVVRQRFDDYVASLTNGGPLLPVRREEPDAAMAR